MKLTKTTLALSLCMLLVHANARDLLDEVVEVVDGDAAEVVLTPKPDDCPGGPGDDCTGKGCCQGNLRCSVPNSQGERICMSNADDEGDNQGGAANDCLEVQVVSDICECIEDTPGLRVTNYIVRYPVNDKQNQCTNENEVELDPEACPENASNPCDSPVPCTPEQPQCDPDGDPDDVDQDCDNNDGSVTDWWCNPGGQCAACPVGLTEKQVVARATTEEEKVAVVKDHKRKNCCVPQGLKKKHCDYCEDAECDGVEA